MFIGFGPDIKMGVILEKGNVIDVAPTCAELLGVTMENVDGEPMLELLK